MGAIDCSSAMRAIDQITMQEGYELADASEPTLKPKRGDGPEKGAAGRRRSICAAVREGLLVLCIAWRSPMPCQPRLRTARWATSCVLSANAAMDKHQKVGQTVEFRKGGRRQASSRAPQQHLHTRRSAPNSHHCHWSQLTPRLSSSRHNA